MFSDIANLISITTAYNENGVPIPTETRTEVFVNVKSATRSEFYSALQAGMTISKVFTMMLCDYDGQKIIEYDNKKYNITRTYSKDNELLELNCSDLAV